MPDAVRKRPTGRSTGSRPAASAPEARRRAGSALSGRQIILAGGSGGLGSATAEMLASEGAQLIVSYRSNAARAQALAGIARLIQTALDVARAVRFLLEPDNYITGQMLTVDGGLTL